MSLPSLVWLDSHFSLSLVQTACYFPWHLSTDCKTGPPCSGKWYSMSGLPLPLRWWSSAPWGWADPKPQLRESGGLAGQPDGTTAVTRGLKGAAWFECLGVFANIWGNFSWLLLRLDQTRSRISVNFERTNGWKAGSCVSERARCHLNTWPETYFMTWPFKLMASNLLHGLSYVSSFISHFTAPSLPTHPVLLRPRDLWIYYLFHLCS